MVFLVYNKPFNQVSTIYVLTYNKRRIRHKNILCVILYTILIYFLIFLKRNLSLSSTSTENDVLRPWGYQHLGDQTVVRLLSYKLRIENAFLFFTPLSVAYDTVMQLSTRLCHDFLRSKWAREIKGMKTSGNGSCEHEIIENHKKWNMYSYAMLMILFNLVLA